MKRSIVLVIALIGVQFVYGQSLDRQVMGCAGEEVTNTNGSLSYTIGEPLTQTSQDQKLSQGFQQSTASETVSTIELEKYSTDIIAYPNPATDYIKVEGTGTLDGVSYKVLDMQGKEVMNGILSSMLFTLDVSGLANSTYTLLLSNDDGSTHKTIRFVKTTR